MRRATAYCKCWKPSPRPAIRLFCFPHAGGGPTAYSSWAEQLPAKIEVCGIRYPGRETLWRETPCEEIQELAQLLTDELTPYFDVPCAFFGHSLGALVAFEMARLLRRRSMPAPLHLYVSAHCAPDVQSPNMRLGGLSDEKLIDAIRNLEGTPTTVLQAADMLEVLLPTIRADLTMVERYQYVAEPPLACAMTALGGDRDKSVDPNGLKLWAHHTSGGFSVELLNGGHFYLETARETVLDLLKRDLESCQEDVRWIPTRPSAAASLDGHQIHLWRLALDSAAGATDRLLPLLSPDEVARAERFAFPILMRRFQACRATLRSLLSHYTGIPGECLVFEQSPGGKPRLRETGPAGPVEFNVTHSGGFALIAVARTSVGVDLEEIGGLSDLDSMMDSTLATSECDRLRHLSFRRRLEMFFRYWTCKEAIVKATGEGMSCPLKSIILDLCDSGQSPKIIAMNNHRDVSRWSVRSFTPIAGFAGAIAGAHGTSTIAFFDLLDDS